MAQQMILPDRTTLRKLYDQAITEVNATRSNIDLTKGFYAETGDAVFEAGYLALADHAKGTSAQRSSRIHVVSAPAGGGKTSFSYAFMMAVTRYAEVNLEAPYGCVFVVDQIKKADEVYRELDALMPGKVAVWSKEHNRGCKDRTRVPNPAAEFIKDELRLYPIAVVTHAFYSKSDGHKALSVVRDHKFWSRGRALAIVDERPEEVETYQTTLKDAQRIREVIEDKRPDLQGVFDQLMMLMMPETISPINNSLSRPTAKPDEIANQLDWFISTDANRVLRDVGGSVGGLGDLFGFARAMTQGCAFSAVTGSVVHFIGWQSRLILRQGTGTVLLDATADIDGISQICPWRQHTKVPQARYDNLQIVHVPQHTKRQLPTYLKTAKNQRAYVNYMVEVIKAHMEPGQHGLVVCKKMLIDAEKVPQWPDNDPRFKDTRSYTEGFGWDLEGRKLSVIHYGTGIGSNHWQEADIVFLFDEFYLPRRIGVANVQGLRGHRANEGDLAKIDNLRRRYPLIELFMDGHRLRWTKQLALRGNGRNYDQHGTCGKQRLVISSDLKSFTVNVPRLFPGAKRTALTDNGGSSTRATKLIGILSDTNMPSVLTTEQVSRSLGLKARWGTVSRKLLTPGVLKAIEALGWRYVSLKGCKGSRFERISVIRSEAA